MIKKITVCFLVMAIVAGCAQAPGKSEKPVDPPVVEQPQKPVEQEKPEEEMKVKKIDESKDWVYVEKSETLDLYTEADQKMSREKLEEGIQKGQDEFLNWYSTNYTPFPEMTLFKINIDNQEVSEINRFISDIYYEKLEAIGHQILSYKYFLNDEILSIIVHNGSFIPGSDFRREIYIYNIDLSDGRRLNNHDVLNMNNITLPEMKSTLLAFYKNQGGTTPCTQDISEEDRKYCYPDIENFTDERLLEIELIVEDNHVFSLERLNTIDSSNNHKVKIK